MQTNTIDAGTFSKMFLAGAKRLESKKELINELNVFPVPDGDTGTNMNLTIMSAVGEVENITDMNMQTLSKSISSGSLRGARGNSGVILSQLLRGFTKIIRDCDEIDIDTFTQAMQKAVETAYKAVMKPKEGTILTVARGAAEYALEISDKCQSFDEYFKGIVERAEEVLKKTPDMLPVLKEAGVVDSGGQGLLEIFKGGFAYYSGEDVDLVFPSDKANAEADETEESQVIGYKISFIIYKNKNAKSTDTYIAFLENISSEASVSEEGNTFIVKAFTEDPGRALSKALSYGSADKIEIVPCTEKPELCEEKPEEVSTKANEEAKPANEPAEADDKAAVSDSKTEEAKETKENEVSDDKPVSDTPLKEMGIIAVSVGDGLNDIFKGLGVDEIITGGQTMNPSTEDLLTAINKVNAKTVFILPNNKNIILAANQARYLVEDKEVIVIPAKTIPQGITALINFMSDNTPKENEEAMISGIANVKTGQVTFAVRDTVINGLEIRQGNIMGIGDKEILAVGNLVEDTALQMIDKMVDDDSELICIYYGEEVDEEIAAEFAHTVEEQYPDCDVEIHQGGQPIYYYIVSVE